MRRSMAQRLALHRAELERLLAGDGEAIAQAAELRRRVEALERAVDEDRVLLDEWGRVG